MNNYNEHSKIFGKSCFNCNLCCADTEPETIHTEYWCQDFKRIIMNRTATLNTYCDDWTLRKDEK